LEGVVKIPRRFLIEKIELKNLPKISRKYNVEIKLYNDKLMNKYTCVETEKEYYAG